MRKKTSISSSFLLLFISATLPCILFSSSATPDFSNNPTPRPVSSPDASFSITNTSTVTKVRTSPSIPLSHSKTLESDPSTLLSKLGKAIFSNPLNLIGDWSGPNVCDYTGVFCFPSLKDPHLRVVSGIDLNHDDIAEYLPKELGLLMDLALFHISSNRFCGIMPHKFKNLKLLFELVLSNNRFADESPYVVLDLPSLTFLDLQFNEFEGKIPKALFDKDLDAIFINHNRFALDLPDNIENSPVSMIVLLNNRFSGCVPPFRLVSFLAVDWDEEVEVDGGREDGLM